jgi:hypothetical protein
VGGGGGICDARYRITFAQAGLQKGNAPYANALWPGGEEGGGSYYLRVDEKGECN